MTFIRFALAIVLVAIIIFGAIISPTAVAETVFIIQDTKTTNNESNLLLVRIVAVYDPAVTANMSQEVHLESEPAPGAPPEHDPRPSFRSNIRIGLWTEEEYLSHHATQFQNLEHGGSKEIEPGTVLAHDEHGLSGVFPLDEDGRTHFYVELPENGTLVLTNAVRAKYVNKSICDGWVFAMGQYPAMAMSRDNVSSPYELEAPYGIKCYSLTFGQEYLPAPSSGLLVVFAALAAHKLPRRPLRPRNGGPS